MNTRNQGTQQNETDLVAAASNGNLEAFNQLVRNHQDLVYNHVSLILGDHASADDVTQDTFIKTFKNLKDFRGGALRSWLIKIATNSAYDVLRRSKRRPIQPLFPEDENGDPMNSASWLIDQSASVQEVVEQNEFSNSIVKLLEELPDVYRTVLTMIDIQDFDYAEASQALNIPIGTVKSRLARARFNMKEKLLNQKLRDYTYLKCQTA